MFEFVLGCALFFAFGYFVGIKTAAKSHKRQEIDDKAEREKRKFERELQNFYNYTGDEQE